MMGLGRGEKAVHLCGYVSQVSCIEQKIYCRRLRCPHCGDVSEYLEGQPRDMCCEITDNADVEEDLSARYITLL